MTGTWCRASTTQCVYVADCMHCLEYLLTIVTHKHTLSSLSFKSYRLGPDAEMLSEILHDLGKRHLQYGVSVHFVPFFGQALLHAMSRALGDDAWTNELKEAWSDVFDALSLEMMKSMVLPSSASK